MASVQALGTLLSTLQTMAAESNIERQEDDARYCFLPYKTWHGVCESVASQTRVGAPASLRVYTSQLVAEGYIGHTAKHDGWRGRWVKMDCTYERPS